MEIILDVKGSTFYCFDVRYDKSKGMVSCPKPLYIDFFSEGYNLGRDTHPVQCQMIGSTIVKIFELSLLTFEQ
jgi:hypothetical protein